MNALFLRQIDFAGYPVSLRLKGSEPNSKNRSKAFDPVELFWIPYNASATSILLSLSLSLYSIPFNRLSFTDDLISVSP